MSSSSSGNSSGLSFCGALFIVFLVLRLCGVISWSWWWVAAPLWMPLAIALPIAFLIFAYLMLKQGRS